MVQSVSGVIGMARETLQERASWQVQLLRACTSDDSVQALPIQEKRGQVIKCLRSTLKYYMQAGAKVEASRTLELCLLVERSTTVAEVLKSKVRQANETPVSNTGVRPGEYDALSDYIAGGKHG